MALLKQWITQRPWLAAGLAGATGGILGIGSSLSSLMFTRGGVKARISDFEHPLRQRILRTLEKNPGLCYRELQSHLSAANGTLRHHLDVLTSRKAITIISVNGRTCYFAGAPSQIEVLRGMDVGESKAAIVIPIVLTLAQLTIIQELRSNRITSTQFTLTRIIAPTGAADHSVDTDHSPCCRHR